MQAAVRTLCDHDPDWLFRRLLREARLWMEEERAKLATLLQDSSSAQVQSMAIVYFCSSSLWPMHVLVLVSLSLCSASSSSYHQLLLPSFANDEVRSFDVESLPRG